MMQERDCFRVKVPWDWIVAIQFAAREGEESDQYGDARTSSGSSSSDDDDDEASPSPAGEPGLLHVCQVNRAQLLAGHRAPLRGALPVSGLAPGGGGGADAVVSATGAGAASPRGEGATGQGGTVTAPRSSRPMVCVIGGGAAGAEGR